jgi:hypothetical protein
MVCIVDRDVPEHKRRRERVDLLPIVFAVAAGLLINEVADISPWLARRIVDHASARYAQKSPETAELYTEEWSAIVSERPGKVLKLLTALRFLFGVYGVALTSALRKSGRNRWEASSTQQWRFRHSARLAVLATGVSVTLAISVNLVSFIDDRFTSYSAAIAATTALAGLVVTWVTGRPRRPSAALIIESLRKQSRPRLETPGGLLDDNLLYDSIKMANYASGEQLEAITRVVESRSQQRVIIAGAPGSGKTAFLQDIARRILNAPGSAGHVLPVMFSVIKWNGAATSISVRVAELLVERFGISHTEAYRLVIDGQLMLLVDGLDEVQADSRKVVVARLREGLDARPNISAVVACRSQEYEGLEPLFAGFLPIWLKPVRDKDVRRYLDILSSWHPEADFGSLERAIARDPDFRNAVRSPALLLLVSRTFLTGQYVASASNLDESWLPIKIGTRFVRKGSLEDAAATYEATSHGQSIQAAVGSLLLGITLSEMGGTPAAQVALTRGVETYGELLESRAPLQLGKWGLSETERKVLVAIPYGFSFDESRISSSTLVPLSTVHEAIRSLQHKGLLVAQDSETGTAWRISDAAVPLRAVE